jgi:hypothetical protein
MLSSSSTADCVVLAAEVSAHKADDCDGGPDATPSMGEHTQLLGQRQEQQQRRRRHSQHSQHSSAASSSRLAAVGPVACELLQQLGSPPMVGCWAAAAVGMATPLRDQLFEPEGGLRIVQVRGWLFPRSYALSPCVPAKLGLTPWPVCMRPPPPRTATRTGLHRHVWRVLHPLPAADAGRHAGQGPGQGQGACARHRGRGRRTPRAAAAAWHGLAAGGARRGVPACARQDVPASDAASKRSAHR